MTGTPQAIDRRALVLSLGCALPTALVAVLQLGRLHPDEVFQFLEPANHRAFGYGVLAWEWQEGLRNWAIPGLFAGILRICAAVGVDHPQLRRAACELPQFALHATALWCAFRFTARRLPPAKALWAIPLLGFTGLVIHFGGRTMSESWSTALLLCAIERLDAGGPRRAAVGGLLLGLAVIARYGSLPAVAAAGLVLVIERRVRDTFATLGGALIAAAFLGALDWATWGAPFHSLRAYLEFNIFSGKGAETFGTLPVSFYAQFWGALVLWTWPGLAWGLFGRPSSRSCWALAPALGSLAATLATPHKEARFLYPALVLLEVAAIPGWLSLLSRWRPMVERLALIGSLAAGLALLPWLERYGGGLNTLAPQMPGQFRLTVRASRDATGLLLLNDGMWGSPGFFYLGKNLPWTRCHQASEPEFAAAMADRSVNRVVSVEGRAHAELAAAGFVLLATDAESALWGR